MGWALVGSLFRPLVGSLFRRSVALASGALSPSGVSRLGFFLWSWFGLGLVGCGLAWVPTFFWRNSPYLVLAGSYCLVVQAPCVSWTLCWGSFLSLPVFADSSGWLRMVFDYPASVAWWRLVLPWFSVGVCRLARLGLQCLWVPWSCGVHSLSDGASCLRLELCSSSVRDRDIALPSFGWVWFLAFVRGPLPQAGAVFFSMS